MANIDKIREFYISRRKIRFRKLALIIAAVVLLTLLFGTIVVFLILSCLNTVPETDIPSAVTTAAVETITPDQTAAPVTEPAPPDTTPVTEPTTTEPVDTGEVVYLKDYDFTKPVPESSPVDTSYFDDALFIGDSRTEGFRMYAGLNNAVYYSNKGLTAGSSFTEYFIQPLDSFKIPKEVKTSANGKLTVAQAIEYGNSFNKIYIMLGINELGWINTNAFINYYKSLIELVRKYNPDAIIYVQLILPVSDSKSKSDKIFNNSRIAIFNGLIVRMCVDENVFYVNVPEAVADKDGALPEDAGVDGIHMKRAYCERWRDYLFTHTVTVA